MTNSWLHRLAAPREPAARLFCFSHAGGNSAAFRPWRAGLPADVELVTLQLPGRANRLREKPIESMDRLVEAIMEAIRPELDLPFVFFGHSMGAVLAWAVVRALADRGRPLPGHLVVSARRPPWMPNREPDLRPLSDEAFVAEMVRRYGGIPAELIRHADVMELLLPAIRADIAALETFRPPAGPPLPVPISAFGGAEDRLVTREDLEAWRAETSGQFRTRMFRGGHFYLEEQRAALLLDLSVLLAALPRRILYAGAE